MTRNTEDVEISILQSESSSDPNERMKELLQQRHTRLSKPDPDSDNYHTTLNIGKGKSIVTPASGGDDHNSGIVKDMGPKLYNSAKNWDAHHFINVLQEVSNQKKLPVSDIMNSVCILSGNTLLHLAASNGNSNLVEVIVSHFPSLLNRENQKGDTAAHVAAKAGKALVLQVINSKRKEFSNTLSPIYCGLTNRHVAWTDVSLKVKNKQGNTPLQEALINGHEQLAEELVQEDCSVSYFPNKEDKSAFYLAAEAGYIYCLEIMLKDAAHYGSTQQIFRGKSPVHAAIRKKHKGALDKLLKEQPQLIHLRDEEGMASLHYAAWMGYDEGVSYLVENYGEDVIKKDQNGQLPIHLASMNGHIKIIDQLLKQHYNPHEMLNENGQNILHVAAESGKYDVVIYILKIHQKLYEHLINEKDHDGNTPLHLATMRWHPKIVSALTWDNRVNLNAINNEDFTVLDAAKYYMDVIPTFQQRLTWSTLQASGAPQFQSGKILKARRQAYMQSNLPNTDNYKEKKPAASSSMITNARRRDFTHMKPTEIDSFKDRVNTLLLVATLTATVTFAAGFTMPGGYNSSDPDPGIATMISYHMFQLFVLCDTIAMFTSLVVAVTLIWAQLGDISLVGTALRLAVPLLGIALTMMSFAFMAGVYLAVSNLKWLASTILVMAVFFLIVLVALFLPLGFPFTSRHPVFRYITFYFICLVTYIFRRS